MDANKLLKSINNLNEYIRISQDVSSINYDDVKIQFNMSTILALKKIRSLEIEYFNKFEENGVGIKMYEFLLLLPPSKTWSLLGKELIYLLKYWLDAMRKHLIFHNNHWWSFLQILLKFIKEIRVKDSKMNNVLLEETAECLLDLATHNKPDPIQRHEIVCLFNLCGADSTREIRFVLRKQLDCYFIKLSALLASCGDVAIQYSILEALLRWLLPRQDKVVRMEAATRWFPGHLFSRAAVDVFLERLWRDFFQDARDFINVHNASGDLVTSVVCKGLSVGSTVVIAGGGSRAHWLDLNSATGRLSVTLEPSAMETLGGEWTGGCGTLVLTEASAVEVKLYREVSEAVVSLVSSRPPLVVPSLVGVVLDGDHRVLLAISISDAARLDKALRELFADKYQVLFDIASVGAVSPRDVRPHRNRDGNEVEKKFSCSVEPRRKRHAGYIVKTKISGGLASPSTASTSSLAQLHDKLAALPRYDYEKEPVSVCARPQLSSVTEVSETDDRQSLNASFSAVKPRPYGVCHKSSSSKAHVDGGKRQAYTKCLSPVAAEEGNSVSCLLVATIGSADESVINDTLERFPQSKDGNAGNILDLLVLEAFQSKNGSKEVIEATNIESNKAAPSNPVEEPADDALRGNPKGRACTVVSNSSYTEDSNTDVVEGTQFSHVNVDRRRNRDNSGLPWKRDAAAAPVKTFDERAVEEFFTQHFAENINGEVVISPTLAKKINETSSETSEEFDACEREADLETSQRAVPDAEVIECVNFILDRICNEFRKCPEVMSTCIEIADKGADNNSHTAEAIKSPTQVNVDLKTPKARVKKATKGIKLKFTSNKNTRTTRQRSKLELVERTKEINKVDSKIQDRSTPIITDSKVENSKMDTPIVRRKRKLYSPKDERCNEKCAEDNVTTNAAPEVRSYERKKPITYYKQVEQERNEYMKKLRNRKLKSKQLDLSPKTKRLNEAFDNLKNGTQGDEKVVLADRTNANDIAIYNFTSDSEDEDFKKGTFKRRTASIKTDTPREGKKKTQAKRKRANRSKARVKIEKPIDALVDERMRETTVDILNTSVEPRDCPEDKAIENIAPMITIEHEMEPIEETIPMESIDSKTANRKVKKTEKTVSLKAKGLAKATLALNDTADRTESPLPGLVVEATAPHDSIANDSVTANMMRKFQEIYERRSDFNGTERDSTRNLLQIDSLDSSRAPNPTEDRDISKDYLNTSKPSTSKTSPVHNQKRKLKSVEDSENLRTERTRSSSALKEKNKVDSAKYRNEGGSRNQTVTNKRSSAELQVIDISGGYSEKSFDTVGHSPITAHGDFALCENDVPPSRDSLNRNLEPRNLEVDDLDQSAKDYFTDLMKEIAEGTFDLRAKTKFSDINSDSDENEINNGTKAKSRVQSKPIPSKLSDVNSTFEDASNKRAVTKIKSPLVSVTRLSSDDINKWLPSRLNSELDASSAIMVHKDRATIDSERQSDQNQASSKSKDKRGEEIRRKSVISPIRLFDDIKPFTSQNSDWSNTIDFGKHAGNRFYTKKASPGTRKSNADSSDVKSSFKSIVETTRASRSDVKVTSTPTSGSKKRRVAADAQERRLDSDPSISSVNEWFDRIAPVTSQVEAVNVGFKDNVSSIMEKLDTTLVEIHHNTSNRLAGMFTEAKARLGQLRRERRLLYRRTASELLSGVLRLVDEHFTELDRRSQEMDEQFMNELKESARKLVRDDCTKKKAMVRLLREDVQAVMDLISKGEKAKMQ